jgi:hypothetical protein
MAKELLINVEDDVAVRNYYDGIKKSPELLAEYMHNFYEDNSKKFKWKTQKKTRVPFKDLPKENKKVMMALAKKVIDLFGGSK